MNHIGPVRIGTPRLTLRPFTENDAQAMYDNWASDPEVTKFLTWPTHPSVEITREILSLWADRDSLTNYNWCIALKDTDEAIGSIAVVAIDEETETLEIGYCISRRFWGQGVVPEAAKALTDTLFKHVRPKRITAKHDVNNPNSGKVMRKIGMRFHETRTAENNTGTCTVDVYCISRLDSHPLTDAHKREICAWKYEGEYAVYNLPPFEEMAARQAGFTNPDRAQDYTGFSENGELVGYVNLREKPSEVCIGVGVRPDLCGQGLGLRILEAAEAISRERCLSKPLCLEVRTWNERAIRCYRRAGFRIVTEAYRQPDRAGWFVKMKKD